MVVEINQIVISILWGSLMLVYLLGDVIRLFSGTIVPGEMDGKKVGGTVWMVVAVMMVIPIVMVVLSLFLPFGVIKWISTIATGFFVLLNIAGFLSYKAFDKFLLVVSFGINFVILYFVWTI